MSTTLRELKVTKPYMHGPDVIAVQKAANSRNAARWQEKFLIEVDGEFGPATAAACAHAAWLLGAAETTLKAARGGRLTVGAQRMIRLMARRTPVQLARARKRRPKAPPLRERAYRVALTQVGVMETGGNNQGIPFTRYERANDATAPESWCGDFIAWCYRQAGSKRVQRAWAAVRLILGLFGIVATKRPQRGDLVRYDFEGPGSLSHVGMYGRSLGGGQIETIEGNTGPVGAVSDSKTGGDGVYMKHRSTSLVHDYLHVLG